MPKPTVLRTSIWIGVAGAGAALVATVLNPLLASTAGAQLASFASETAKYAALATGFFLVFWVFLANPLASRKLSRKPWPKRAQMGREAVFSLCSMIMFIAVDIWIAFLVPQSKANSYGEIAEYGWLYYAAVLFAVFVVHDTYFYWMHRLLHHPRLYERIHRVHHESTDPTPYTAYHFHPVEAFTEGLASASVLIVFLLVPWHVSIPFVWGIGQLTLNVIGHLGYEIYPSWWHRAPQLKWKTPSMHHYLHHQMVRGNYGLYFRWWDKICGTEFNDYEKRYDALFARAAKPASPAPESGAA